MTLGEFIEKSITSEEFPLNRVPVKHPETKKKIYIENYWLSGFWYRHKPGQTKGRIWPCHYPGIDGLVVHPDWKKELKHEVTLKRKRVRKPLK